MSDNFVNYQQILNDDLALDDMFEEDLDVNDENNLIKTSNNGQQQQCTRNIPEEVY